MAPIFPHSRLSPFVAQLEAVAELGIVPKECNPRVERCVGFALPGVSDLSDPEQVYSTILTHPEQVQTFLTDPRQYSPDQSWFQTVLEVGRTLSAHVVTGGASTISLAATAGLRDIGVSIPAELELANRITDPLTPTIGGDIVGLFDDPFGTLGDFFSDVNFGEIAGSLVTEVGLPLLQRELLPVAQPVRNIPFQGPMLPTSMGEPVLTSAGSIPGFRPKPKKPISVLS